MKLKETNIKGLVIIEPTVFEDERGYFYESYNDAKFKELTGFNGNFVQDNQSLSQAGILRGLHFQNPPFAQGKLVRVIKGAVLDVAVDIRKNSSTFGQHVAIELNESNKLMFWIPEGFAHGFLSLENDTIFSYKCTNTYNKISEGCIKWNDKDLNINWGIENPIVSSKDEEGSDFKSFQSNF